MLYNVCKLRIESLLLESAPHNKDRMNKLPDSILESCIIPLLPMRDAVQTSRISRRWRHLWRHSILTRRNLEINCANVNGSRPRVNDDLGKFMKQYMEHFEGENIDSLKVEQDFTVAPISTPNNFLFWHISTGNLDDWIRFAIARGVEEIQLLMDWSLTKGNRYVFPHQLLFQGFQGSSSTLKHLALLKCDLRPPPDFDGFNNLRSLSLNFVRVDQITMAHLLSNCLLLESLEIRDCNGLSHLNIVGDHLRDLKLSQYERIEISAPNLVSLEYGGDITSIIFVIIPPCLARILTVVFSPAVFSCLTSFPELETLFLQYFDKGRGLPQISSDLTFRNLKQLSLRPLQWGKFDHNLDHLRSVRELIMAAPLLEEFVLTSYYTARVPDEIRNNVEFSGSFTHDHLKRVEMQGFVGYWYEIEFAIWILKNAAKLETLVINPGGQIYDLISARWSNLPGEDPSWKKDRIVLQEKLEQVNTTNAQITLRPYPTVSPNS